MPVSLPLSIDRIRITGIGLTKEQYHTARERFPQLVAFCMNVVKTGKALYTGKAYTHAVSYRASSLQLIARLEIGTTKAKHYYLAWELWPMGLSQSDFTGFHWCVMQVLPLPIYHYPFAFTQGRVKYLELARDTMAAAMHTFLPWKSKVQKSAIYEAGHHKGAIYIGSRTSEKQFCIYDKAKQLSEVKAPTKFKTLTRIEARLRKLELSPA